MAQGARIPLPTDEELGERQREVLAAVPPLNVFRMLAGTRWGLKPFLQLGRAVLTSALDARRREIVVLRVAHATGAEYERHQHERLARASGVNDAEITAIAADATVVALDEEANFLCRVADEISRDVRLSDEALQELVERYGAREAAEVILLVSYYNMVSRVLESTRVPLEREPPADVEAMVPRS
ncbi:MAG TPA: carboxymuconolactone decarboxylase family protein [Solirubrobacteraceae bacterium]|nr:carboxymuconolactone decarboxylase family protein [Solirubrobacteraceae bacterium]